jgi:hypothetical protein
MTSNREKHESPSDPLRKPSFQFPISIAVGVLVILLLAATYYYGVIGL